MELQWRKWDGTAVTERDIQRTCDLATHVGLHIWVTDNDGVARDYVMDFGNSEQISNHEYLYRFEGYTPEKHRLGDLTFIYDTDTKQTTALDFSSRNVLDEVGAKFLITQPPTIDSNTWIIEDKDGTEIAIEDILAECEDGKSPRLWVYGLQDKLEPDMRLMFTSKHTTDVGEVYYFNGSGLNAVAEFTVTIVEDGTKLLAYNCNILNAGGGTKQYTSIHDSTKEEDKNLVFNSWKQMFTDLSNNTTCNMYVKGDDTIKEEGRPLNYSGNTPYGTNQRLHTWKHATSQTVATLTAIENIADHTLSSYRYEIRPVGDPVTVEAIVTEDESHYGRDWYLVFDGYTDSEVIDLVKEGKSVTIHAVHSDDTGEVDLEWYLPFTSQIPHATDTSKFDYLWTGMSVANGIFGSETLSDTGDNIFAFDEADTEWKVFKAKLRINEYNIDASPWGDDLMISSPSSPTIQLDWTEGTPDELTDYLENGGTKALLRITFMGVPWLDHTRWSEYAEKGFVYVGKSHGKTLSGSNDAKIYNFQSYNLVKEDFYKADPIIYYHQTVPETIDVKMDGYGRVSIIFHRNFSNISTLMRAVRREKFYNRTFNINPWVNNHTNPTMKAVWDLCVARSQYILRQPMSPDMRFHIRHEDGSFDPDLDYVVYDDLINDCELGKVPKILIEAGEYAGNKDVYAIYTGRKDGAYYFVGNNEEATGIFKLVPNTSDQKLFHPYYDYYTHAQFEQWRYSKTYKKDDIVWFYDTTSQKYGIYFSTQDGNQGRPPASYKKFWQGISGGGAEEWNKDSTYSTNDQVWVKGADGKYNYYFSRLDSNINHYPPENDSVYWSLVSDNMVTVYTMPEPSQRIFDNGLIYKYAGETTTSFVNGKEYKCIKDGSNFIWQIIDPVPAYTTMPTASKSILSLIAKYTGTSNKDFVKDHVYQCVLDGTTYKWKDVTPPETTGEPTVIELASTVHLIVSDTFVTCIFSGNHNSTSPATIPSQYRPKHTVWCTGTKDWTNFAGVASINASGAIQLGDTAFYGSCSWAIGDSVSVLNLNNGVYLLYGDTTCTLILDGASTSSYHGTVIPEKFRPKHMVCAPCSANWTAFRGLTWVNTAGEIACNSQTGNAYGSFSWQYANGFVHESVEVTPPTGNMYAGYVGSIPTATDGKVRIYTGGSNFVSFTSGAVTYQSKRQLRIRGCFRQNVGTGTTSKLGKLYWGNKLITQDYDTWSWGVCWQQNGCVHAAGYRTNDGITIYKGYGAFNSSSDEWIDIIINTNFDLY